MKINRFYYKFLLVVFLAGLAPLLSLKAQEYEKSRKLVQTFAATAETSVQIINKYGNVHILPWDKDSISFEVNIKVEANKQSKVEKTFENIEIEFSETSYYVIAQTVFGNQKNAFWSDVSDFTNSMLKNGSNAQIDYTVYLPSDLELTLELKFGNLYMTDHEAKALITISNGDFRGGNFSDLELNHDFGNVVIDTINTGSLTLSYTELKLNYTEDIRIESKSSKPKIDSFKSLRMNSRRDSWYFKNAGLINGETSFSHLVIEELNADLIMNTNYGSLRIDKYGKDFSMMNLYASYSDVSVVCDGIPAYFLEVYYDNKTRMIYPKSPPIFTEKVIDENESEMLLSGNAGQASGDTPRIKITIDGGSVNLIHP